MSARVRLTGVVVASAGAEFGRAGPRRDHSPAGVAVPGGVVAGHQRAERNPGQAAGLKLVSWGPAPKIRVMREQAMAEDWFLAAVDRVADAGR